MAYLGVKAGLRLPEGALVVFDTGGGSTQFTFGQGARVDEQFSVNVGAVRYTERFGWPAWSPSTCCTARSARSPPICRGSRAVRRRTPWWRWVA